MVVEKLSIDDHRPRILIEKINELVDKVNQLDKHYHTVYNIPEAGDKTSFPRLDDSSD